MKAPFCLKYKENIAWQLVRAVFTEFSILTDITINSGPIWRAFTGEPPGTFGTLVHPTNTSIFTRLGVAVRSLAVDTDRVLRECY